MAALILGADLRARVAARFASWVNRRIPPARSVTLDQRRIFIFPSRVGFFFFACLLLMLIAAINYENNMSFALTFLLATLFVIAVLHSYANLSGLTLQAVSAANAFQGQQVGFVIRLLCRNRRGHHALWLAWQSAQQRGGADAIEQPAGVEAGSTELVTLFATAPHRGWFTPGRLRVQSTYPLGLLRCWTYVDLDFAALIYPRPQTSPDPVARSGSGDRGLPVARSGEDEFYGLRDYRRGDRPRQVYWKGLARGQALQSKQYSDTAVDTDWLEWDAYPGIGVERRLSYLCHHCLLLHRQNRRYGLRLPGLTLDSGLGEGQRDRVLRALALYEAGR